MWQKRQMTAVEEFKKCLGKQMAELSSCLSQKLRTVAEMNSCWTDLQLLVVLVAEFEVQPY